MAGWLNNCAQVRSNNSACVTACSWLGWWWVDWLSHGAQVASISSDPALQTDSGAYSLSGTWRCMGYGSVANILATLWLRIS